MDISTSELPKSTTRPVMGSPLAGMAPSFRWRMRITSDSMYSGLVP